MLNMATTSGQSKLGVSIAGVSLSIDAPHQIVDVLRSTLYSVPPIAEASPSLAVSARRAEDSWEVTGSSGKCKMLDGKSSGTQVAGALVSSAVAEAAQARSLRTVRATVVEINGLALAMIGSDWESTVTIATHLHTRGWRYLSGDHALYDPMTNEILGFEKALYVTSSSIAHLPVAYRGAIEASALVRNPSRNLILCRRSEVSFVGDALGGRISIARRSPRRRTRR